MGFYDQFDLLSRKDLRTSELVGPETSQDFAIDFFHPYNSRRNIAPRRSCTNLLPEGEAPIIMGNAKTVRADV